jgi:hypothetical protein
VDARTNTRRTAAIVLAAALLVPALLGATKLAGWATGSSSDGSSGRAATARALSDFADAMRAAEELTFTVVYTTASGAEVTHAQEPPRRAYRSLAGVYVSGPDATHMCRTPRGERPTCSRAAGADSVPLGHAKALAGVLDGDFLAPELVGAYLSRLAARDAGRIDRSERVIAGQQTSCIAIVRLFTACATQTGILAHFSAPEGALTMTAYAPTAAPDLFALPRNAAVTEVASD